GVDPGIVLGVLLLTLGAERFYFQVDWEKPLQAQFRRIESWIIRARREIHGQGTMKARARREAARDTLVFTLRYSSGLATKDIAKYLIEKKFDRSSEDSVHARVRTSLSRMRPVLKTAGIGIPDLKRNVTRKRSKL